MILNRRHFLSLMPVAAVPPRFSSSRGTHTLQPTAAASFPALRQRIDGRLVEALVEIA